MQNVPSNVTDVEDHTRLNQAGPQKDDYNAAGFVNA